MHRHVLITGVSSGIGKATALYLLAKNVPVIGSVRRKADAKHLEDSFPKLFTPVVFDVRDSEAISKAVEEIKILVGTNGLGAIVNNAGIAISGPMQHVKADYMRKQMDVNVHGLLEVTQAFLPLLGADKDSPFKPGRLINISSVSGRMTRMMMGPYSASKYAVEAISDAFRRELKIYGIQVSIVEPGPIDTEIWEKARSEDQPYEDTDYAFILQHREKIIAQNEKMSIAAEKVAKTVDHAIFSSRPKTRYLVTGKKWLIRPIISFLPTRWVDYLFTRPFLKMYEQS